MMTKSTDSLRRCQHTWKEVEPSRTKRTLRVERSEGNAWYARLVRSEIMAVRTTAIYGTYY